MLLFLTRHGLFMSTSRSKRLFLTTVFGIFTFLTNRLRLFENIQLRKLFFPIEINISFATASIEIKIPFTTNITIIIIFLATFIIVRILHATQL